MMAPEQFPWVFLIAVIAVLVFTMIAVAQHDKPARHVSAFIAYLFAVLAIVFGLMVGIMWVYKALWDVMPA